MLDLLETRCSVWIPICRISHICMTDMTSLISFLLILFHYWAAFVVYQLSWANNTTWISLANIFLLIIFRLGLFGLLTDQGAKISPTPKICHTYPTMMKVSKVTPYLTKIQNIYKSHDTPIKFYWHQYFFAKNQQL